MHRFGTATEQPSQLFINSACRQEKSSFCRSPIVSASVRSVAISADKARILVGTLSCEVVEFVAEAGWLAGCNFATRGDVGSTQWDRLVAGHFEGELWGLAVRPNTDQFCTARFGFASSLLSFSFSLIVAALLRLFAALNQADFDHLDWLGRRQRRRQHKQRFGGFFLWIGRKH